LSPRGRPTSSNSKPIAEEKASKQKDFEYNEELVNLNLIKKFDMEAVLD